MLPNISLNLCYTVIAFLLIGFYNDVQRKLYPTLPLVMQNVINSTLLRYNIDPTEMSISILTSLMNGTTSIATAFSIIFILPMVDTKGRKFVCVYLRSILGLLTSIFHLGCAVFVSAEFYIISEIFYGASTPIRMFATALFISESSPDKFRGFATFSLFMGDSVANTLMFSLTSPNILGKTDTWFIFPLTNLVLSVVCFCMLIRIPDSPKWLVRQNQVEKAKHAVQFYHGSLDEGVIDSMIRENNLTESKKLSLKEILGDETLREAFVIVLLVNGFTWLSPNAIESLYVQQLHSDVGFSVEETLAISFIFSLLFSPAQFLGTILVDSWGRRKLALIGGSIMIVKTWITTSSLTIASLFGASLLTKALMILSDIISNIQSNMGAASLGSLLVTELFPPSARTAAGQMMTFVGVFAMLPLSTIFPIIYAFFTPAYYFPFLFFQPILLYLIYKKLPETKQRAVCDIIESMYISVASRRTTMISERTPLIKNRAISLVIEKNGILPNERKRSKTIHYDKFNFNVLSDNV